jgi:MFS family permease
MMNRPANSKTPGSTRAPYGLLPGLVFACMAVAIVSSLGTPLTPTIATTEHVSLTDAQWAVTITLLVGAVASPAMGRLEDGPRRREVFLFALSAMVPGGVLAALSHDFGLLLTGRGLQGLGLGVGSIFAVMPAYFLRAVPATETGSATSFNQILRYVGYSVGSAPSAVLLQAHTAPGHRRPTNGGYTVVGVVSCLLWVLTGAAAIVLPLRRTRRSPGPSRGRPVRRRFARCPVQ